MQGIKIGYVHQSLWHGILVCLIVICPFLASAEEHDMQSEPQETTDRQNQSDRQATQQDIQDIIAPMIRDYATTLIETQETLKAHITRYMVILGILLLTILSVFTWLFFRYRRIDHELNNVKHQIEFSTRVNSSLKQDLSDISSRIQRLVKTSDIEKLSTENQESIQEILKLLKPPVDEPTNEVSAPSEEVESPEHILKDTRDLELTPAIANLCDNYNAGIQDKNKRNDFLQHYRNSYKIHVENATDRRVNPQIDPVFKTHHAAGDFLGCYVEEEKSYVVVPAYQLRIVHAILQYGAFVDVFECHEHEFDDPDGCYEVVRIIKPAIFEPDDAKETWTLQSKGILELKEV